MTGAGVSLPYPHARNDCGMCRERDADVLVVGGHGELAASGKRPVVLCQNCLGPYAAMRTHQGAGRGCDQPVTITLTCAPGRRP